MTTLDDANEALSRLASQMEEFAPNAYETARCIEALIDAKLRAPLPSAAQALALLDDAERTRTFGPIIEALRLVLRAKPSGGGLPDVLPAGTIAVVHEAKLRISVSGWRRAEPGGRYYAPDGDSIAPEAIDRSTLPKPADGKGERPAVGERGELLRIEDALREEGIEINGEYNPLGEALTEAFNIGANWERARHPTPAPARAVEPWFTWPEQPTQQAEVYRAIAALLSLSALPETPNLSSSGTVITIEFARAVETATDGEGASDEELRNIYKLGFDVEIERQVAESRTTYSTDRAADAACRALYNAGLRDGRAFERKLKP